MENQKGTGSTGEDSEKLEPIEFKKNDFTIFMEEMSDGFQRFHIKSGEVF